MNKSGIVLFTVLLIVSMMTVLTIAIINLNVNQAKINEQQINRIKAEQLAYGAYWVNYSLLRANPAASPVTVQDTLDGKFFQATTSQQALGGGPNATTGYAISVNY